MRKDSTDNGTPNGSEILVVSLNHLVTPLEVREQVAFDEQAAVGFLEAAKARLEADEVTLISTCNRTEIYLLHGSGDVDRHQRVLELLSEKRAFTAVDRPRNHAIGRDEEAVRHLFRVAGGLESQILGESQVLGQVKTALSWAQSAGTVGRVLQRLWERALRVGKRVRTETALGEGALSASYAALALARKVFGTLEEKKVLVVGTGEIGVLALENLRGIPLSELTIMNRTRMHAEELARRFEGRVRDLEALPEALVEADLVISSTSAAEPLIDYETMRTVRRQRGGQRPLLVVDLAVPRDFDAQCGSVDGVFLKNLDDLGEIVHQNVMERRQEIPTAERIVEEEVATFLEWMHTLEVEPTIRKLREIFHAVRAEELEALRDALDDESFRRVEYLTRRLVNRLLHIPTENLRRQMGPTNREVIALVHRLLTEEIPHPKERDTEGSFPGENEG